MADNNILFARRSIRKYRKGPMKFSGNGSTFCEKSATLASYIVIDDKKILDRIAEIQLYTKTLYEAPLAIAVYVDIKIISNAYLVQDCAAETQNILLAAMAKGLGSWWCGIIQERKG